jgi:hypothetical protein
MSEKALTLRCSRCQDVRKLELALLRPVPMWVSMVEEACRVGGVKAIRIDGCDSCRLTLVARDQMDVLADLKRSIEGK